MIWVGLGIGAADFMQSVHVWSDEHDWICTGSRKGQGSGASSMTTLSCVVYQHCGFLAFVVYRIINVHQGGAAGCAIHTNGLQH